MERLKPNKAKQGERQLRARVGKKLDRVVVLLRSVRKDLKTYMGKTG